MPPTHTLLPLQRAHQSPRNFRNAGNSCYISSLLVSLFADFDALDALLLAPTPLCDALRRAVNLVRSAQPVSLPRVRALRAALIDAGWHRGTGQQDVAELLAFLFDALSAPFVPLYNNILHARTPDPADHVPSTERLLWLDVPPPPPSAPRVHLRALLDDYFFAQTRPGLRRQGVGVDATVAKSLLPFYTPDRETGETVRATRHKFRYLTLPLALKRFGAHSGEKRRDPVSIPTALDCTDYVNEFAGGARYSMLLRSVVCHRGPSIGAGHYVAYTYGPRVGWRQWNDLDEGAVRSARGSAATGEPEREMWAEEIARDSYLLLYELVPGDGEVKGAAWRTELQILADAHLAAQRQFQEDRSAALRVSADAGGVDASYFARRRFCSCASAGDDGVVGKALFLGRDRRTSEKTALPRFCGACYICILMLILARCEVHGFGATSRFGAPFEVGS
ncbi:unnamed protein product [Chondrus crispus]|uniref:ubiquitinyl hydrolase 1 n=1 Tax=Chondrus crispus TaxID=2769 RepID=R7QFM5_CHOCR|nr:unnamed protein product [Chondrus crispus]CDF37332.1 unnamed protein product [Chondrus crispus]|eukprot:XP_005717151.1 unnamed protein product [Chondrus crispus]